MVPAPIVAVPPGAADDDTTGPVKDPVAAGVVATGDITRMKKGTSIPVKQYANLDEKTRDIGVLQEMLAVNTEVVAVIFDEIESAAVTLKMSQRPPALSGMALVETSGTPTADEVKAMQYMITHGFTHSTTTTKAVVIARPISDCAWCGTRLGSALKAKLAIGHTEAEWSKVAHAATGLLLVKALCVDQVSRDKLSGSAIADCINVLERGQLPTGYNPLLAGVVHLVGEPSSTAEAKRFGAHVIRLALAAYHAQDHPEELIENIFSKGTMSDGDLDAKLRQGRPMHSCTSGSDNLVKRRIFRRVRASKTGKVGKASSL